MAAFSEALRKAWLWLNEDDTDAVEACSRAERCSAPNFEALEKTANEASEGLLLISSYAECRRSTTATTNT